MSTERWLPIESNPDVMNSFLRKVGVPEEWEINDVFGLDDELLQMLPQPVLALLLLFPINDKQEQTPGSDPEQISSKVFYMKQTISNACGTVALLHSVANNTDSIKLKEGALKEYLTDSDDKSPEKRAELLEADDAICQQHDDAAKEGQTSAPGREDSVDYHFVTFVHVDGQLYELDGRKSGPVVVGLSCKETFLKDAAGACKQYMSRDPENINFTVLALTAKME
ncbi:ubiquitin carboxyl-terminal hydrolase isozyme L3 [Eurytemora carolleeae]|uniref:ubiquitin carboxyl-terminal hydrolase isozyme L3 n=1 Tax=Eurytemora carolleeae TaxID=1294199 RepID=UPI000C786BA0|nr:ubiquitin carboxyl-terminal hydrolase isozyme L3 [Eurytemora carolleeae]|eukprot:XP_023322187.1 ubiquitin carboxyl-terminal hydrolase isozyme L3-like [Eurytemora affinis]